MDDRHSGIGIASFAISLVTGPLLLGVFVIAGILYNAHRGAQYPGQTLVGFATMGLMALDAVAFGLGIASIVQPKRNKLFGILGLVFSGMTMLGTAGLIFIGLIAAGRL
jgi:hypothetical protein